LASQPPASRAASLRPASSGSLYLNNSVSSFPAPPGRQQQRSLATAPQPPPPLPPAPQQDEVAIIEPAAAPIVDPFASSNTTDLVDSIIPAALPSTYAIQPPATELEDLALVSEELPAAAVEEEEEKVEEKEIDSVEQQDVLPVPVSPPVYQNPFTTSPQKEEEEELNCNDILNSISTAGAEEAVGEDVGVVAEEVDISYKNPFLIAEKEEIGSNTAMEGVNGDVDSVQEIEKSIEMPEDDDFDAFEQAPADFAVASASVVENDEWVNPFEVAQEEKEEEDVAVVGVVVIEEEQQEEEQPVVAEALEEEGEDEFAEFEWAPTAAAESSPGSVENTTSIDAVDNGGIALETEPVVEENEVIILEEKEEPLAAVVEPSKEEFIMSAEEEKVAEMEVDGIEQGENEEEEDDFDEFCAADDAPTVEEEKEEAVVAVPTAKEVAEGLAATLPDLSFMLSDSLVKRSP
jgi:hypothetical protein